ncbi:MAG TPA: protein kinase, partial [Polyangiaceae bacterium]|nr:protein kinase [Polyangiaceae bacterium]
KGKVAYMAPEQIRLAKLDRKTDIFAAGIVVYLLTTGRHPFKQADQHETALAICSDEPAAPPSSFLPNYPKKLERVVLRALAKSPAERYDTAREFGEELAKALPPSLEREPRAEIQAYMEQLLPTQREEGLRLVRDALGAGASWELTPCTSGIGEAANSASGATLRAVSASLAAPIDLDAAELEMLPDEPFGAADLPRLASLARPARSGWRTSARLASTVALGVAIGAIVMFAASRRTEPAHGVLAAQPVSAPDFRPVGLSETPATTEPPRPAAPPIAAAAAPVAPAASVASVALPKKSVSLAEAVLMAKKAGNVAEPVDQPSSGAPANSRINGGALRKSE